MHHHIRLFDFRPGTLDADPLHRIIRFPQAGSVDEIDGHTLDADLFDDTITGGAGNGRDDGHVGTSQCIEQAGFAHVRRTGQHDIEALTQPGTAPGRAEKLLQGLVDAVQPPSRIGLLQKIDFFFGEIQRGFDQHAQREQLFGQVIDLAGKHALQRAGGGTGRLFGAGLDEIGHSFGLHEIELVVQKGPFGEFSGLGQANAVRLPHLQHAPQQNLLHHGATMALQFEDVLARVGMRRRKPQGQAVVDGLAAFGQERSVAGVAGFQGAMCHHTRHSHAGNGLRYTDCFARTRRHIGRRTGKGSTQHLTCNGLDDAAFRRGNTDDTNGTLAGRSGDGADGTFVLHGGNPKMRMNGIRCSPVASPGPSGAADRPIRAAAAATGWPGSGSVRDAPGRWRWQCCRYRHGEPAGQRTG